MDGLRPLADDVTTAYLENYQQLVRIATMLLKEPAAAEDVVQDAYLRVSASAGRMRDRAKVLAYLRQAVINGARSHLRRRLIAIRHAPPTALDTPGADEGVYVAFERQAVINALRGLPSRQREVIVLRYYADLTEKQTAETLGLSVGSVKAYASRGLDKMGQLLEDLR